MRIPKRMIRVWIQFAIALCLFLVLNFFIGKIYSSSTILLSFTAWESVGNSNWYILAILVLYFLSFFGGILTRKHNLATIFFVIVGCCVYVIVLVICGKGSWYYDTIFCYPLGMLYAFYEQKIKSLLEKKGTYLMIIVGCGVAFVAAYLCSLLCHGVIWLAMVELRGIFFVLLVVLATSRIKIGNPVLNWLGEHTFEIYILQRLPMITLSEMDLNPYTYFVICAAVTVFIALLYHKLMGLLLLRYCSKS